MKREEYEPIKVLLLKAFLEGSLTLSRETEADPTVATLKMKISEAKKMALRDKEKFPEIYEKFRQLKVRILNPTSVEVFRVVDSREFFKAKVDSLRQGQVPSLESAF